MFSQATLSLVMSTSLITNKHPKHRKNITMTIGSSQQRHFVHPWHRAALKQWSYCYSPPNNPLGLTLALSGPSDLLTCTLLAFRPRNARHFHPGAGGTRRADDRPTTVIRHHRAAINFSKVTKQITTTRTRNDGFSLVRKQTARASKCYENAFYFVW